jgi:hypothetical protein
MWLSGGVEFCGSFCNGVRHGWYKVVIFTSAVSCARACSWGGGGKEKWVQRLGSKGSNASLKGLTLLSV